MTKLRKIFSEISAKIISKNEELKNKITKLKNKKNEPPKKKNWQKFF